MPSEAHEVFVSYSWDSDEHVRRVLSFAQGLRAAGVDAWVDKFETPSEPWPLWCYRQVQGAGHVLAACTERYQRRVMREEEPGSGRGATWEGAILTNELYDKTSGQDRVIPIVFSDADRRYVPYFLEGYTVYDVSDPQSLTELYGRLTDQRTIVPAPIGTRVQLAQEVLETALPVGGETQRAVASPSGASDSGLWPALTPSAAGAVPSPSAGEEGAPHPGLADTVGNLTLPPRTDTPPLQLAQVIEGVWILDTRHPMFGTQTMRVQLGRTPIGLAQFQAEAVVGTPGWRGFGEWEVLPPGDRVALRGTQTIPMPYQVGPIQESYAFTSISRDVLEGVNSFGIPVTWRRQ